MAIKTLEEKFLHGLGDMYDAEHQFLKAMEQMRPQATSDTVKTMLDEHITQTEGQIENLESVFEALDESAERVKCKGAAGIVSEGQELTKETADNPALLDLAIVGSCAKVEHYEIAGYRGLVAAAQGMNKPQVVQLLTQNLQQEESTAQKLEQNMPTLLQKAMSRKAGA
ncbi:MAG: DUF892 family protein [Ilumatobacteraceae bacterium]|jgi:ferritin-like metal-binding protein YciE|nr:ferritin-like domain-containing protein [Pyrinomonadaceae bacterium]